ncbi:SET and MYND domain-containing protein 4-like [Leptopilina heterotoma]|uniref:SET and MYND domain-containing protein 4-like n=1 Tax=Leptopilina heterotoma TaxID=63436 RepID=UPI001CAA2B83|nr:SET and MYND domain-containing protein 4-like [Leptopilina heterotoma]XP_043461474.1 SET and MYND domain-containing protein 4-like [Leptopilina heterotoma]
MEHLDPFYRTLCSSETLRSSKKGFFAEFSETVMEQAGETWIQKIFGKLENDDDRISAIFNDTKVKNIVLDTLKRIIHFYRDKDATISKEKRVEGLRLSALDEHEKALMLLSQAVLRAPTTGKIPAIDEGFSLPFALIARADILITLGEYDLAFEDLQMADEQPLNKAIKEKLQQKRNEYRNHLEKLKKSLVLPKNKRESKSGKLPDLTAGENPSLPAASNLLKIQETTFAGRQAVAAMEINPNDTLAVESPLASCLLPEFYGSHCQNCFARLRAPVGCPDCSSVAFCGRKCRDQALSSYHKYECKVLALLIGSGMSVLSTLAFRMVSQEGLEKCLKMYEKVNTKNEENISTTAANVEKFTKMSKSAKRRLRKKKLKESSQNATEEDSVTSNESSDENLLDIRAYDLVMLSSKRTAQDFLERTIMASFLLKCLQCVGFFKNPSKPNEPPSNEETKVGSLLLKNLQVLQFNAHEVFETRLGNQHRFRGSKPVYIGVAIYPTVARFNHECYGAVTRYFVGRNIVIKALRTLKPGEVVAENYGPIFTKRNLMDRQRTLGGRYWFQCSCIACRENWPTFENMTADSVRLKCPTQNCDKLFGQPREKNKLVKCSDCQKKVNLDSRLDELTKCLTLYTEGLDLMELEKPEDAVNKFTEALKIFHKIASPPHRMTHLAEIAMATCMADGGNTWRPSSFNV